MGIRLGGWRVTAGRMREGSAVCHLSAVWKAQRQTRRDRRVRRVTAALAGVGDRGFSAASSEQGGNRWLGRLGSPRSVFLPSRLSEGWRTGFTWGGSSNAVTGSKACARREAPLSLQKTRCRKPDIELQTREPSPCQVL